ncbi:hypothetical protein WOLCODRAFT_101208 [Wolfiporia cocos MD-104 SS10]|uniref:Uncharacterized protein n=1 Tax=Wolfiporia cocos (strain MD-104) TaxID=742152 RepID=A0A2H3JIV6_WOLCO|nr:hypothetical protein WOLCODRAFT_101208 [Wolfiporia cocos MD-104 SS10]
MFGDVGLIDGGSFRRLFNATLPAKHPINTKYGVPDGFVPIKIKTEGCVNKEVISTRVFTSPSVTVSTSDGNSNPDGEESTGGLKFQCVDEQGALLVLKEDAVHEELQPSRMMMRYMSQNHASWYIFAAKRLNIHIAREGIVFVRGFIKTADWAVATWIQEGRSSQFHFSGDFNTPMRNAIKVTLAEEYAEPPKYAMGPPERENYLRAGFSVPSRFDQCIFLHYYKIRSPIPFLPTSIKASAGPYDPPLGPNDDPGFALIGTTLSTSSSAGDKTRHYKPRDVAEHILDYILTRSDAISAIASDQDVARLCEGRCIVPDAIPELLQEVRPHVEVDSNGVGRLCMESDDHRILDLNGDDDDILKKAAVTTVMRQDPSVLHNSTKTGFTHMGCSVVTGNALGLTSRWRVQRTAAV